MKPPAPQKKTGTRRKGRILIVQFLYQRDLLHAQPTPIDQSLDAFWKIVDFSTAAREFAEPLIHGIIQHGAKLDQIISQSSLNWDIKRMSHIDRNIIRLGLYEIIHCPDVPPAVAINEAIEIAKEFGDKDSVKFINGVLDRARKDLNIADKRPTPKKPR